MAELAAATFPVERDASANSATHGWLAEPKLGAKAGVHGRICTDTVRVLSAPSLRWTTWAKLVPRERFGFPSPATRWIPKKDVLYRELSSIPGGRPPLAAACQGLGQRGVKIEAR
jgi:hypothetical protein